MDYSTFEVEDFMLDPSFVRWVTNGENDTLWQKIVIENPDRKEVIGQARAIILATRSMPDAQISGERKHVLWKKIYRNTIGVKPSPLLVIWRNSTWRRVAAVVLILLGWASWTYLKRSASPGVSYEKLITAAEKVQSGLTEHVNASDSVLSVQLPDGSLVRLQPDSRISYFQDGFQELRREVYISGEAFFNVVKDPSRPFFVYANELVTRVLGTSFNVKAYPDDSQVKVSVKTGKVSVFTRTPDHVDHNSKKWDGKGTLLTANQEVSLHRKNLQLSKTLVDKPEVLEPAADAPGAFEFDDALVTDILKKLESAYGVEIIYDEELLASCRITAALSNEPLYEKVRLICQALEAEYEIIDAKIVIHSTGCN